MEAEQWRSMLILWLQCWHLIGVLACVPAAPLPIKPSAYGLGKQRKMTHVLGPVHQCGKRERRSHFPFSAQLSSGHCGNLGSGPTDARPLMSFLLNK